MRTEIAALQNQFTTLNATMAAARNNAAPADKTRVYRDQLKQLAEIRDMYNANAVASGDWHAQTVKTISASQRLTEQIRTNKLSAMQAFKEIGKYQRSIHDTTGRATSSLREAMREQTALRNAMTSQMTGQAFGPNKVDLLTPKRLGPELDSIRTRYGMINQLISSAARNTINWGKNTQWAGRQISVGFTMPLMLAASAAGYLAFKVDKELTNIARVYDTTATDAAGKERELSQLRENSLRDATAMTQQYGVAITDVLEIQSKLAATGLNGSNLQQYSRETMRIATLGDFDPEVAAEMTISLTTAFRDEIKTVGDLTETFDFYNIVAQETSLQIEDIAAAIPRAASAMSALGVTTKEMGVLMVALRESGVDPEVGANALKSATATLLNPPREAVEYWKETLGKDLPAIVEESGGNLFNFLQRMGEELHGLDPQIVQTAITKTFGKYQFDRATALVTNFGDAMTGTANQTKTAMDLMGVSAEGLAEQSAAELEKLHKSISFKFKAALNGIQAALIPFGETVLTVLTPIIEFVGWLIRGFNDMNPILKNTLMALAVGAAVVGPLLMLVGIFANLMGNVVRAGTAIANIGLRFRALNADEAAAQIATRNANSMFDMQTRSAATLALTIDRLTASLKTYTAAQEIANGVTTASAGATSAATGAAGARSAGNYIAAMPLGARPGGAQRTMASQSINEARYGIPMASQQASGAARQAAMSMLPTVAAIQSGKVAASAMANDAAKANKSFSSIGRNMGMVAGLIAVSMPMFMQGADAGNQAFINIAMIAGTLLIMFPGMIGGLVRGVKKLGPLLTAAFSGPAIASFFANMKLLFLTGARSGIKAMGSTLAAMAPRFAAIAGSALKIGLPIAALAATAWVIKGIVDDMHQIAADSEAMSKSTESWSETIGYSFNPGIMPGLADPEAIETGNRASELAKDMAESVEGLGEAFAGISDESDAFERAMQQALKVLTTGGTVEDARLAFEASLEMMDIDEVTLDRLLLKFDDVELDDPEAIRQAISDNLHNLMSIGEGPNAVPIDVAISPLDSASGFGENIAAFTEEIFGGDLSGQAESLATDLGDSFGTALQASVDNIHIKADMFAEYAEAASQMFQGTFDEYMGDHVQVSAWVDQMGIETMDELMTVYEDIRNMDEDQRSAAQQGLMDSIIQSGGFDQLIDAYDQFLDRYIDGMVAAGVISEAQATDMKDDVWSIMDMRDKLLGQGVVGTILPKDAEENYEKQIQAMITAGAPFDEQMQLAILNSHRAAAGLEKADSVAQGFGDAADVAASGVVDLNNALDTTEISAEQWASTMRSAMEGTMDDIYSEASRLYDEQKEAELDSMRESLDNTMEYYDVLIDATNDNYDNLENANEKHWDAILEQNDQAQEDAMDGAEAYWDSQIESIENAKNAYVDQADARIEALRAEIEAEQAANDEREKIFEAEQRRIERMAERLNTNIDFNVSLNSGDLDAAARISNDVSARESKWSLEDQNRGLAEASEARVDTLEGRIDQIEVEKDARTEAFDLQLEQTKKAKDAAIQALNDRQEAERKALEDQRKIDEERLKSSRETAVRDLEYKRDYARQGMESFIADVQKQNEADKRGLEQRLRELQAFTPRNQKELDQHIEAVEALYAEYGINLTGQGEVWSGVIRDSLTRNIEIATMQMQNDMNWEAVGKQISSRISGGIGITAGDLQFFLRNGRFPFVSSGDWLGFGNIMQNIDGMIANIQGIDLGRHSGGLVFHKGGSPAFSQADRVGVPRSASIYPSEVTALLKRGEYVVNEKATRRNYGMLEAINSGKLSQSDMMMSRHEGGVADTAPLIAGGVGQMFGQTLEQAVKANAIRAKLAMAGTMVGMLKQRIEESAAANTANSTGTLEAGNAPWQRLWNTIKRQFPEARLNDSTRPGANDYHGQGMAVDLGWMRAPGGNGNPYMASMNRWIYDNFHGSTELIYNGTGDDRPNLKNGRDFAYSAGIQAGHKNHVHWAMTPQAIEAAGIAINSGAAKGVASGNVQQQVLAEANRWGYGNGANWNAIDWVINRESSWNPNAQNPTSTASGLFQHIDGTWNSYKRAGVAARKMRLAPVAEQAYAGMNYFKGRYGSPVNARAFWERNHWYDQGGWMMPGEAGRNGTNKPEPVFTGAQWDVLKSNIGSTTYDVPGRAGAVTPVRVVNDVATGSHTVYDIDIDLRGAYIKEEIDIQTAVEKAIDARESRNGRRRVIGG